MTTICTDGKSIAADSQSLNSSSTAFRVQKMWKLKDGSILACAGAYQDALLALEWFTNAGEKPKLDESFNGILVRGVRIFKIENALVPWEVHPPFAIGSGRDFALMALHLGLSPYKAIQEIIERRLDVGTGGIVQTLPIGDSNVP